MAGDSVDFAYLAYQYGDAEKLWARLETHERYSEQQGTFRDWLIGHVAFERGMLVADIGCGPGAYHAAIVERGGRIVATDLSRGMAREALASGRRMGGAVAVAVADAQALPLREASVERVMANHMLYHVPDREGALREMRRVLKRRGRAVLATNAAGNYAALHVLHRAAARDVGFEAADAERFTLDDVALVRAVFPGARVFERRDALVFREAAPALRFYASYRIDGIERRPADGSHRPLLLGAMERRIKEIIERDGVLRVAKSAGCFVADV
ncbi:MAG TPA: class I SAM-dependent methyltransferase [Dehalococcoidia bacterium]|nr:class I SAM-dependent methyltransferase [Dehalococcoidia bacterium]